MTNIQKESESQPPSYKETKKLTELFNFIRALPKEQYPEKEFNRELILFFGISDFRVVGLKTKLLSTLGLIEIKTQGWGEKTIWIRKKK